MGVVIAQTPPIGSPVELGDSRWVFEPLGGVRGEDLIAVGADLNPQTLVAAYRHGLFPMGVGAQGVGPIGWWCPASRGVLGPGDLHISRSLRRALRNFEIRIDTAFGAVVAGCAEENRPGRWITDELAAAYAVLHHLGWAHSVEAWQNNRLVGGLYGVSIGGLFAGESMFHTCTDASKVALVGLVDYLEALGESRSPWLVDVQWHTAHLGTLGVHEISREEYLETMAPLLRQQHRWPGARHGRPTRHDRAPAG